MRLLRFSSCDFVSVDAPLAGTFTNHLTCRLGTMLFCSQKLPLNASLYPAAPRTLSVPMFPDIVTQVDEKDNRNNNTATGHTYSHKIGRALKSGQAMLAEGEARVWKAQLVQVYPVEFSEQFGEIPEALGVACCHFVECLVESNTTGLVSPDSQFCTPSVPLPKVERNSAKVCEGHIQKLDHWQPAATHLPEVLQQPWRHQWMWTISKQTQYGLMIPVIRRESSH